MTTQEARFNGEQRAELIRVQERVAQFKLELAVLINKHSMESLCANTPDFILAEYIVGALGAYSRGVLNTYGFYAQQQRDAVRVIVPTDEGTVPEGDAKGATPEGENWIESAMPTDLAIGPG